MKKARQLSIEKKPGEAAALFEKVADKAADRNADRGRAGADVYAAEAAYAAAHIYQYDLKDFEKAVHRYRQVIQLSDKADIRRESQIKLASILFYDQQDFAGAVTEFSRLLALQHSNEEEIEWRSRIAKAYYYQGDYFQSKIEVDKTLKLPLTEEALYQAQLLKANIAIGAREHDEAAKVLSQMIEKFPDRAKKDSLALMLAVAFEEQRNFDKAIETLERIRSFDSRKAFLDEKIKSLKERQGQQPGARGFRK